MFNRGYKYIFFAQQATAFHQGDTWANWLVSLPADKRPKTAAYPTLDDHLTNAKAVNDALPKTGAKSGKNHAKPTAASASGGTGLLLI
jgi:branched-chain amino acid transport system substrate-binding protein